MSRDNWLKEKYNTQESESLISRFLFGVFSGYWLEQIFTWSNCRLSHFMVHFQWLRLSMLSSSMAQILPSNIFLFFFHPKTVLKRGSYQKWKWKRNSLDWNLSTCISDSNFIACKLNMAVVIGEVIYLPNSEIPNQILVIFGLSVINEQ